MSKTLFIVLALILLGSSFTQGSNLWDRPVFVFNESQLNMTIEQIVITTVNNLNLTSGTNGTNGVNGTNGINGVNGTNGVNGLNGTDGTDGTDGIDGVNGLNGTNGIDGVNGTNGVNGLNGTQFNVGDGYLYNVSNTIFFNESKLNDTVNIISKNRHEQLIFYVNVTSGSGIFTTTFINYLITKVSVWSPSTGNFNFELTESNNVIDKNRITHSNVWIIEKNYAINNTMNANITNSNVDGIFNVTIDYVQNGLTP